MLIPEQIDFLSLPEADGSDNGDRNISGTITRTCGGGQRIHNSSRPWSIPPSPTWAAHPLEWFPATIPADIQSFHRVHFNCFVVIKRLWVESHWTSSEFPKKHCFQPLYLHKRKAFDGSVLWWWLSSSPECQWLQDGFTRADLSEHTHSAPCVGTFLSRYKCKL